MLFKKFDGQKRNLANVVYPGQINVQTVDKLLIHCTVLCLIPEHLQSRLVKSGGAVNRKDLLLLRLLHGTKIITAPTIPFKIGIDCCYFNIGLNIKLNIKPNRVVVISVMNTVQQKSMTMKMLKLLSVPALISVMLILVSATELSKETERLQNATKVITTFANSDESIPEELLKQSEGLVIIPKMINAGFGIGGKRGKGVAVVKLPDGSWSNPVFITLTGGSFGFQIGVQSVDLVLVFKHKGVLTKVKNGDFTIGGDISAAAGPVGRSSTASTDHTLEAEVYSYSRSRGLFAGISINGSNLAIDKSANANFYGSNTTSQQIFETGKSSSAPVVELKGSLKGL